MFLDLIEFMYLTCFPIIMSLSAETIKEVRLKGTVLVSPDF